MLQLITILNRCHRFPGFVYRNARFSPDHKSIEIAVRPRKGSAAVCSRCRQPAPGYDQLSERRFEFIPFRGFLGFSALLHAARRLPNLPGGRRRGSAVGRRKAYADPSVHAVSGPLGAPPVVERNRRGVPHFMGKGFRRRRTRRHLRSGTPGARSDRCYRGR